MTTPHHPPLTQRLCGACGMCCDGTLFHGLRLQKGDVPRRLAALGLKAKRAFVAQPCPAHGGSGCTIYEERPVRCRKFSCVQLQAVLSGAQPEAEALAMIAQAHLLRRRVHSLLRESGESREHKPLAARYAAVFAPPQDPAPAAEARRAELRAAMEELENHLSRFFRPEPLSEAI